MIKFNYDDIKKTSLDILDAVHKFCISNNLKYSLAFGTLIGAIRHNGFIPWDDDVDIMMPRKDYEYFVKNFDLANYGIMTYTNCKKYHLPYAKVYSKDTIKLEPLLKSDQYNIGFNIDLFPLDFIDSKDEYLKLKKRTYKLNKMRSFAVLNYKNEKNIFKKIVKFFLRLPFIGTANHFSRKIDLNFFSNKSNGKYLIYNEIYVFHKNYIFNGQLFDKLITHKFEGKDYFIIAEYDSFLTTCYGDYMTPPPKEKRVSHHDFEAYYVR